MKKRPTKEVRLNDEYVMTIDNEIEHETALRIVKREGECSAYYNRTCLECPFRIPRGSNPCAVHKLISTGYSDFRLKILKKFGY